MAEVEIVGRSGRARRVRARRSGRPRKRPSRKVRTGRMGPDQDAPGLRRDRHPQRTRTIAHAGGHRLPGWSVRDHRPVLAHLPDTVVFSRDLEDADPVELQPGHPRGLDPATVEFLQHPMSRAPSGPLYSTVNSATAVAGTPPGLSVQDDDITAAASRRRSAYWAMPTRRRPEVPRTPTTAATMSAAAVGPEAVWVVPQRASPCRHRSIYKSTSPRW